MDVKGKGALVPRENFHGSFSHTIPNFAIYTRKIKELNKNLLT